MAVSFGELKLELCTTTAMKVGGHYIEFMVVELKEDRSLCQEDWKFKVSGILNFEIQSTRPFKLLI